MKPTIRLLSSARIHRKEDDSKLHPPFGDHHTCRRRGKDAAAHDDSDLVGRPLLWLTNVWNPISPAVSVSSPCRPNENTIEQGEDVLPKSRPTVVSCACAITSPHGSFLGLQKIVPTTQSDYF